MAGVRRTDLLVGLALVLSSGLAWGQNAPTATPTSIQDCVAAWSKSRETIRLQEGVLLVEEVLQRADRSGRPVQLHGCAYVYGLLDRVRMESKSAITIGEFELVLGEGKQQLTIRGGKPPRYGGVMLSPSGMIDATAVGETCIGDSCVTGFEGVRRGDSFEGVLYFEKKQKLSQKLKVFSMRSDPDGQNLPLPENWHGIIPKAVKPWGKDVRVRARFYNFSSISLSTGDYIDGVLLNAWGAHFGAKNLGESVEKLWDQTLANLAKWSQSMWTSSSGLISAESTPGTTFKIVLDGSEIGDTPFTFPVTADTEHKIAYHGALQAETNIQLKDGERRIIELKDGKLIIIVAP